MSFSESLSGRKAMMEGTIQPGINWEALEAACHTGDEARDGLRKAALKAALSIEVGSEQHAFAVQLAREWPCPAALLWL